ncbi:DUF3365 domain-containing protein [Pseudoalteromonas sp. APC 3250]|jgi:Protein of unknown function (DUF3365)|uniref:Tll0287-like domain-containing protein n=1 Tax=Pseudoalteromonas sp. APC 3250 TaxID=3035184 RepID=UPI0025B32BCC|nr:DUF3365 domain-containing protein [Pseudoalteromonas sp. APC 3250]MDN3411620.1 DUF3365 domain-containing protein [Pseudoalteromonas sp. APC 3250]
MLKNYLVLILIMGFTPLAVNSTSLGENNKSVLEQEAQKRIKEFSSSLKSQLKSAINKGGLSAGVKVCSEQAPKIAEQLSTDGWSVGRTSLRTRNTSNTADQWELKTLVDFEKLKQQGIEVNTLAKSNYDEQSFRYMKAIPTGGLCLACHGSSVTPEVKKVIQHYYPEDKAIGFNVGDIRGAFTLIKQLKATN